MDRSKQRKTTLEPGQPFDFSQASLQDYLDCPKRFQLRYLQQLHWPAPQAEPIRENEAAIRRGERFHRLAQQALVGVPPERLERAAAADPDPALARWWQHFQALLPSLQQGQLSVETLLAAPLGKYRLLAKYDLVQILPDEGKAVIYDWKTSPIPPRRARLAQRMQTRVYPYLLARAGAALNNRQPILPARIEMVYWFAEFPAQVERFAYTEKRFKQDGSELAGLVAEIAGLKEDQFPKTEDEKICRFCVYRSLCARGDQAGLLEESEEDFEPEGEIEINIDQIGEIGF
jgi:hypothetical protein